MSIDEFVIPRGLQRRAWIEAWELEEQVAGRERWSFHREGTPDVMVHPGTGTVHVLGPISGQGHGWLSVSELVSWPGEVGALALEHMLAAGWDVPLYGRIQKADDLCGWDTSFLCERVGAQWGSCGVEVPRATGMDAPSVSAKVCGTCVRRTPGWTADGLRELARSTHDERTAADVASAARVAANLGASP